jgi:hypothetical protein
MSPSIGIAQRQARKGKATTIEEQGRSAYVVRGGGQEQELEGWVWVMGDL